MLRRPPVNLNKQSQDATILLIREVIDSGIELTEVRAYICIGKQSSHVYQQVYVDALGPTKAYEAYLTSQFPGIQFTVTAKADSKFKIVGAASVAAKVTRDAWIEGWIYEEASPVEDLGPQTSTEEERASHPWDVETGSGYPSGTYFVFATRTLL